jgi:hypothetical protein
LRRTADTIGPMDLPRLFAPRRRLAIAADAAGIVIFAVVGLI